MNKFKELQLEQTRGVGDGARSATLLGVTGASGGAIGGSIGSSSAGANFSITEKLTGKANGHLSAAEANIGSGNQNAAQVNIYKAAVMTSAAANTLRD